MRSKKLLVTALSLLMPASAMAAPPPASFELLGVVRDFQMLGEPNGHPDFEQEEDWGVDRIYCGRLIEPVLGTDAKPVYDGPGRHVEDHFLDSAGRPISYTMYDPGLGDTPGTWGSVYDAGIDSETSFNEWWNDVPGINMSAPLSVTMVRQGDGTYVFDSDLDPFYVARGGFFPIDNLLFGNTAGSNPDNHNYHFTFELHARFVYDASAGQIFEFFGDDDVWVFMNGQLVVDVGDRHWPRGQFVDLDRLGLADGETYALDLFFAERRKFGSNCRITTNMPLISGPNVNTSGCFD